MLESIFLNCLFKTLRNPYFLYFTTLNNKNHHRVILPFSNQVMEGGNGVWRQQSWIFLMSCGQTSAPLTGNNHSALSLKFSMRLSFTLTSKIAFA
jgi:hypothetical protein